MRRFLAVFLTVLSWRAQADGPPSRPAGKEEPVTQWIWFAAEPKAHEKVYFRREFHLPPEVVSASVSIACDDIFHLWINGREVGHGEDWRTVKNYDNIASYLKGGGKNVIAVEGANETGFAGMALRFRVTLKNGLKLYITTDGKWLCSHEAPEGWEQEKFEPQNWQAAVSVAKMGEGPWTQVIQPEPVDDDIRVASGFRLERLYHVPKEQGSWVSITADDKGRLLCSDQYGKIYRVSHSTGPESQVNVEPLNLPLQGAQGLLWFQGALYVCVNEGGDQSGVWRVTDTNGDGEVDKPELLKAFTGRGEHGPHSLVASPDGQWLYVCCGDFTDLPKLDGSLPSPVWGEDQLLPRRPDPRGHAIDRMAPGGWIARFKPDNSRWELVSVGYRNEFDLGFNDQGDLFTYDSDMEWDLGMPWYRPTRICQVAPGSEYGWRNGTGKWPDYYEDSMAPALDIGPGSPTGVVFGRGAKFPAKYQRAMFALDWTYATISAVHLTPQGSGYKAEREEFITGSGLPLTDAVIGSDGAMYFTTGGRRTDSYLWRVSYTGPEPTEPVEYKARELKLADHAQAWENLGSPDRLTRYQARLALEAGDVNEMVKRLPDEKDPWRIIGGAMALARTAGGDQRAPVLAALDRLDWSSLNSQQKLNYLRAAGLVFIRHGAPTEDDRSRVLAKIDAAFPSNDATLDRELCRMLCYLQAPGIVGRTLAAMDAAGPAPAPDWLTLAKRNSDYGKTVEAMLANQPPAQVIHYAYCLRTVKGPWAPEERKRFFAWFDKLLQSKGGESYAGFITDLRKETLASCTAEERDLLSKQDAPATPNPLANLPQPVGPGREWKLEEIEALTTGDALANRNKDGGKKMFQAAMCAVCHRFGGDGGSAGPDLSAVGGRFQVKDLAEAILEPGKTVSDQYAFSLVTKKDGSQLNGRVIGEKDSHLTLAANAFDFSQTQEIDRSDIEEIKPSPVSPMPAGLLNRLNPDELKDLFAYLLGK